MRRKIVKYGERYLEVEVPDYANGETFSECVVIEPAYEKLKEHKETFIDKIVKFFDDLVYLKAKENVKLRKHKIVNPINVSLIKWRTGEPTKKDGYIVTMGDGSIALDYGEDGKWFIHEEGIIAWCPLSEVKPYK